MAKQKDKEKHETAELTEWQKRNIEFLKKKKEEEAEKQRQQAKLKAERKEQMKAQPEKDNEDTAEAESSEEVAEVVTESSLKNEDLKEDKPDKKLLKKEKSKKLSPHQKVIRRATPILVISSLVLLVSLFVVSPLSKRKQVTVTGYKNALEYDLLTQSEIKDSDYIFSLIFNHGDYEKAVTDANVWVKNARLLYEFPNHFTLKVTEYDIVAYAQSANGYQPILANGQRVETVNASELPEHFISVNLSDEKMQKTFIDSLSKLDKDLVAQIQTVSLADSSTTADLLLLSMINGHTVRVPLSEIEKKLPYYMKIKDNLAEDSIVDMEVGIYTTTPTIEAEIQEEKSEAKKAEEANKKNAEEDDTDVDSTEDQTEAENNQTVSENADIAPAEEGTEEVSSEVTTTDQ
ncbi:cell division protein FtsQ [Streptococcus henryi]|uniref:Cell division protein DivIB n=1 Tax=Streptococcus henryi TaxID=439219 RepID=A0A1G6DL15_9STRE|nr:FtsQ-type POTRA domain-containing protein [Streptococcus henryi]SDB45830.1 cell division protein FtsQ [Streptococcus henryi]